MLLDVNISFPHASGRKNCAMCWGFCVRFVLFTIPVSTVVCIQLSNLCHRLYDTNFVRFFAEDRVLRIHPKPVSNCGLILFSLLIHNTCSNSRKYSFYVTNQCFSKAKFERKINWEILTRFLLKDACKKAARLLAISLQVRKGKDKVISMNSSQIVSHFIKKTSNICC